MFASSIDPKVRSPTEYDIDFKTVKQVESLLNSWPKIPQSPKEKDKEKDDKDREKDLFFPLVFFFFHSIFFFFQFQIIF